jgi:hypothetical protein
VNDHEVCVALVNIQGSLSLREDIIELHYQYHITTLCSFFPVCLFLSNVLSKNTLHARLWFFFFWPSVVLLLYMLLWFKLTVFIQDMEYKRLVIYNSFPMNLWHVTQVIWTQCWTCEFQLEMFQLQTVTKWSYYDIFKVLVYVVGDSFNLN